MKTLLIAAAFILLQDPPPPCPDVDFCDKTLSSIECPVVACLEADVIVDENCMSIWCDYYKQDVYDIYYDACDVSNTVYAAYRKNVIDLIKDFETCCETYPGYCLTLCLGQFTADYHLLESDYKSTLRVLTSAVDTAVGIVWQLFTDKVREMCCNEEQ